MIIDFYSVAVMNLPINTINTAGATKPIIGTKTEGRRFENSDGTDTKGNHTATIGSAASYGTHGSSDDMYIETKAVSYTHLTLPTKA